MNSKAEKIIYLECSHSYFSGGNTGIQRVARNLANHAHLASDEQVKIVPIVWAGVGFFQPTRLLREKPMWIVVFIRKISHIIDEISHIIGKIYQYMPNWLRKSFAYLKQLILPSVSKKVDTELLYYIIGLFAFPLQFVFGKTINFQRQDLVVLVDATWNSPAMLRFLFDKQAHSGLLVGAMIHDLFPLTRPETCQLTTINGYTAWFEEIAARVDYFITNSEATRTSLKNYLSANPTIRPFSYKSKSFRLGATLDLIKDSEKQSRHIDSIDNMPGMIMLSIGTIEPRKNYAYLLDVFSALRDKKQNISWIIIGRNGWKSEEVIERIHSHADFATRLIHIDDATDNDLLYAIDSSDCLLAASIDEGFGLPVVEGLMYGLHVFASDIPSFREIGEGYVTFFDINHVHSLVTQLEQKSASNASIDNSNPMTPFSWPNWLESTREFKSACQSLLTDET